MIGKIIVVFWEECERTTVANAHTQQLSIKNIVKYHHFLLLRLFPNLEVRNQEKKAFGEGNHHKMI